MELDITFTASSAFLAPYEPYPVKRLDSWLQTLLPNPFIQGSVVGSSQEGRPLHLLTISDFSVDSGSQKAVWVHARTHPGEVGSSFVVEGLTEFLSSSSFGADYARRHFIFHILPMLNPDGVAAGNYRSTPKSENLEVMWTLPTTERPPPVEIQIAQKQIWKLDRQNPFCAAINLHATHSETNELPYFVNHFGSLREGYTQDEATLWQQQIELSKSMNDVGPLCVDATEKLGGRSFLKRPFPETVWWHYAGARVVASTFETVYGRVGVNERWITPEDQRSLGKMLALGLVQQQINRRS